MAHTPGPWVYKGNAIIAPNSLDTYGMDNRDFWEVFGHEPDPRVVVSLISAMGGDDTEADANLIAAAPDLLDSCADALDFLDNAPFSMANGVEYMGIDEGEVRGRRILRELSDKLRAAIAKAKGYDAQP